MFGRTKEAGQLNKSGDSQAKSALRQSAAGRKSLCVRVCMCMCCVQRRRFGVLAHVCREQTAASDRGGADAPRQGRGPHARVTRVTRVTRTGHCYRSYSSSYE
jgi:hypothetical protein